MTIISKYLRGNAARRAKTDVLSDRKRVRVLATKLRVGWGRLIAQIEAGVHADFLSYFLGLEVENKIGKSGLPVQKSCVFRSASPRPRRCVGEGRPMHLRARPARRTRPPRLKSSAIERGDLRGPFSPKDRARVGNWQHRDPRCYGAS